MLFRSEEVRAVHVPKQLVHGAVELGLARERHPEQVLDLLARDDQRRRADERAQHCKPAAAGTMSDEVMMMMMDKDDDGGEEKKKRYRAWRRS